MSSVSTGLLAADTRMGSVTLRVADLDAMTAYYRDAVTLTVLSSSGAEAVLGRGAEQVLRLVHTPELRHAPSRSAGLFHTAILFDSEADLATSVHAVASRHPGTYTGSADHLVSQAFYFTDPEGNGVELYTDRDRSAWSWTHGQIEMATLMLDPNRFLPSTSIRPRWPRPPPGPRPSVTCTCVWATSSRPAGSTSSSSASRPRPSSATTRCSSAPVATTTTWR